MASVTITHPHDGHETGTKLDLDDDDAKRLVKGGVAVYADDTPTSAPPSRSSAKPAPELTKDDA